MQRRGQVTLFIVIGVLLLFAILYLSPKSEDNAPVIPTLGIEEQIKYLTEACLLSSTEEGLYILGLQGGYIYPESFPGYYLMNGWNIMFDYYYGFSFLPTIEEMEQYQLAPYIEKKAKRCIDGYSGLQLTSSEVSIGEPKATVQILDNESIVKLQMPVVVRRGNIEKKLNEFTATFPTHLKSIRDTAESIIIQQIRDNANIPLSVLSNSPYSPRMVILEKGLILTELSDESILSRGRPYLFRYASMYGNNTGPQMYLPGEIELGSGEEYQISYNDREGDAVSFYSSNDAILITPDGRLSAALGEYETTLYAYDDKGMYTQQDIKVRVI